MTDRRDDDRVDRVLGAVRASLDESPIPAPPNAFAAGVMRSIRTSAVESSPNGLGEKDLPVAWLLVSRFACGAVSLAVMVLMVAFVSGISPTGIAEDVVISGLVGGAY